MLKNKNIKLILAALFLSIGVVLPLLTSQIKEIGDTLLPMHIPVLLCGLICGGKYGFFVGLILPFLRSLMFGMPQIYPNAVWMAVELATYGLVVGLMYFKLNRKSIISVYISLITAMLLGRVVWGIAKTVLLGINSKPFTFALFITGGFVDAIPGIVLQLILIPLIIQIVNNRRIIK